jgi:Glycosyltransferase family 87
VELRARLRAGLGLSLLVIGLVAAAPASAADLTTPASQTKPPPGFDRTAESVIAIARATPQVRSETRKRGRVLPNAFYKAGRVWQVSWFKQRKEVAQVIVDDRSGKVTEAWTGPQVAWRMARGYPGAFGRKLNAPYVWLPLCLLFVVPFVDPRRPFRLLHLDLLVLLAFGISHIYFNRADIDTSVPLAYPVLLYLLVRMLVAGFRPRRRAGPLLPVVPAGALALALVFLVGFRIGLNVVDSNVIDVGYASVIGADRIMDGDGIYGEFPKDVEHGDTYGTVTYLAYVPFEQLMPWSGRWDDLPAAHGAAITFDLLTMLGLFVLGRRWRRGREGHTLGIALAFAWAAYPYTLFAMNSNSNDTLVGMLVVWALVLLSSAPARGAMLALATGAKFSAGPLVPLFAFGRGRPRARALLLFGAAFLAVLALVVVPWLPDGGLREIYDRTVGYQAARESPFSIWGQEPSLEWLQTVVKVGAIGLALLVSFVPRRRGPAQVAALAAAVLIAFQLAVEYWFYLYIVWFAPLVFVALFASYRSQPVGVTR